VTPPRTGETRARILEAAVVCVERRGLAKTSLEDVANQAGLSRATLYRWFEGGRDQLITETVAWETRRFLTRLAEAIGSQDNLEDQLVQGLVFGHQAVLDHVLLQRILSSEPEVFLTEFHATLPALDQLTRDYFVELLGRARLRPDLDVALAAEYLARLFVSYLGSQGSWDLSDRDAVRALVRTQFLAGIQAPEPTG
jgi:AcrR family transcriptional regulator